MVEGLPVNLLRVFGQMRADGTMPQLGLLLMSIFLPMNLLSGSNTPLESMPHWLATIMQAAEVERKRRMANARNTAPTTATKTNCGQTTSKPAPRPRE